MELELKLQLGRDGDGIGGGQSKTREGLFRVSVVRCTASFGLQKGGMIAGLRSLCRFGQFY